MHTCKKGLMWLDWLIALQRSIPIDTPAEQCDYDRMLDLTRRATDNWLFTSWRAGWWAIAAIRDSGAFLPAALDAVYWEGRRT